MLPNVVALAVLFYGTFIGPDYTLVVSQQQATFQWYDGHKAIARIVVETSDGAGGFVIASSDQSKMTPGDYVVYTSNVLGDHITILRPDETIRWSNSVCWQGANLEANQRIVPLSSTGACTLIRLR